MRERPMPLHLAALGRQIDDELVVPVVPVGERAAAFERHGRLPVHPELPPQPDRRGGERRGIALAHGAGDVGVVGPLVEHARAARAHRCDAVDDRRQFFHLERDAVGQILGLRARRLHAGGDRLSDIARAPIGQRGVGAVAMRGQLRPGLQNIERADVREREDLCRCARGLDDVAHAGVRHLAAYEGDVLDARHADVGNEHPVAEEIALILLAQQARTDPAFGLRVSGHVLIAPRFRCNARS